MIIRRLSALVFSILALHLAHIHAQDERSSSGKLSIGFHATQYGGFLWKHSPKLTIATGQPVWSQEIGIDVQTTGQKPWQTVYRYPVWGFSVMRVPLGAGAHGTGWAFVPNLNLPLLRSKYLTAFFKMGVGATYVPKPHDSFSNPTQNALGSHWNECVQLRLSAAYALTPHLTIESGGNLTHFSNGGYELPNFGINVPSGFLQMTYTPAQHPALPSKKSLPRINMPEKRWGWRVGLGAARSEYITFDGPKYPIWAGQMAVTRRIKPFQILAAGLDWEYNAAVYAWGLRATGFQTRSEARAGATRLALMAASEWQIGPLGIWLQPALHIGPNSINQIRLGKYYNKLSINYYLPVTRADAPARVYAGVTLKAYKAVAEYFGMNLGYQWR